MNYTKRPAPVRDLRLSHDGKKVTKRCLKVIDGEQCPRTAEWLPVLLLPIVPRPDDLEKVLHKETLSVSFQLPHCQGCRERVTVGDFLFSFEQQRIADAIRAQGHGEVDFFQATLTWRRVR